MDKPLQSSQGKVWTGMLIAISYFLLAACMQYEESLAPGSADMMNQIAAENQGVASMHKTTFTAHLSSDNELPLGTVESGGQGQAIFKLSEDGMSLEYKLIVANIKNVLQAHIHCGSATENGSVIVFLFGLVPGGVTVNGVLAEGTITEASLRPGTSCPDLDTFAELLERLRNGTAYVNVHTTFRPAGEIRGQIK